MLKFPTPKDGTLEHIYSNSCISEHIACQIIKTLGLKVQDTILGKYNTPSGEKIVVACKDFTSYGKKIIKERYEKILKYSESLYMR